MNLMLMRKLSIFSRANCKLRVLLASKHCALKQLSLCVFVRCTLGVDVNTEESKSI